MKDYSQSGEQAVILDYFRPPAWPYLTGRFLDVGANDGQLFSNSRMLALMGWGGVCVEPAPIAFEKLSALYPASLPENPAWSSAVKCVQAAITTEDGPIDFYDSGTHLHKGDTSLLSTTVPDELARWKRSGEQFTKTTVRGITFQTLMGELGLLMIRDEKLPSVMKARFDFITIDAEGADLAILRQIDLTAVGCRCLCVEVNARGDAEFTEYAAKHGMRLHWRNFENRIFVR